MAPKSIKKELKRPDEFVSFWTRFATAARDTYTARKRAIIIGSTALVTVVIGSVVFSQIAEDRAVRASQGLERVQKILTAELRPEGAPPKADDAKGADLVPHFKTERERLEGALKELDAFIASQPRGPLRAEAALHRGELLLALDRAADAVPVYEGLLGGSSKLDDRLRFLAREGLGYAHERKGDLDRAQEAFSKLGDDAASMPGFYKDRALYQKARITELRGNRTDATRLYQEVLDKNPTTSLRDEITNRLAVLELK